MKFKFRKVLCAVLMASIFGSSAGTILNFDTIQASYHVWTVSDEGYVNHKDGLYIRKLPDVSSKSIIALPYGTRLIIKVAYETLDPNNTMWYYVKTKSSISAYNGISGYVAAQYVKLIK